MLLSQVPSIVQCLSFSYAITDGSLLVFPRALLNSSLLVPFFSPFWGQSADLHSALRPSSATGLTMSSVIWRNTEAMTFVVVVGGAGALQATRYVTKERAYRHRGLSSDFETRDKEPPHMRTWPNIALLIIPSDFLS